MRDKEQTISNLRKLKSFHNGSYGADIDRAIKALEHEPKTGHWIDTDEGFSPCECSECKLVEFKRSKYCPNCGARMVGDEK